MQTQQQANWPRDSKGHFLPHTGYPKGLKEWMEWNHRRAEYNALDRLLNYACFSGVRN